MFLIRSAFWLGLAFVVIQPQMQDFSAQANTLGDAAMRSGKQFAAHQLDTVTCGSLECASGKALITVSGLLDSPPQASSMQDSPSLVFAPVPRPRLARAG